MTGPGWRHRRRVGAVLAVLATVGLLSGACASREGRRSATVPASVPKLNSSTCVDLALARADLAAPRTPDAVGPARDLMKSKAPGYLQEPIDTLAAAAGNPEQLKQDKELEADKAVSLWLGQACKLD